jgi:hypothetical protein
MTRQAKEADLNEQLNKILFCRSILRMTSGLSTDTIAGVWNAHLAPFVHELKTIYLTTQREV